MKQFWKVWPKDKSGKTEPQAFRTGGRKHTEGQSNIEEALRRVDSQIGRAVTRLSDR